MSASSRREKWFPVASAWGMWMTHEQTQLREGTLALMQPKMSPVFLEQSFTLNDKRSMTLVRTKKIRGPLSRLALPLATAMEASGVSPGPEQYTPMWSVSQWPHASSAGLGIAHTHFKDEELESYWNAVRLINKKPRSQTLLCLTTKSWLSPMENYRFINGFNFHCLQLASPVRISSEWPPQSLCLRSDLLSQFQSQSNPTLNPNTVSVGESFKFLVISCLF